MTRFAEWCAEVAVGCSAPHGHTMVTAVASTFDASVFIVADVMPDHFFVAEPAGRDVCSRCTTGSENTTPPATE